jgi:transcriptional regulator with XRE-family HTH domain
MTDGRKPAPTGDGREPAPGEMGVAHAAGDRAELPDPAEAPGDPTGAAGGGAPAPVAAGDAGDFPEGADLATRCAAFGRYLTQERELRGLGRDEVARATKLTPSVIDAIESGESSRMPPRAYLLGYLRSYANAVGLDADDVILRWQEVEGADEEPRAAARSARTPALAMGLPGRPGAARSRRLAGPVVALVVAIAAAALAALWLAS